MKPNFNQAAYQTRINDLVGTQDGRPLIKLVWSPEEFRWMPHKLGDHSPGYTFPAFCNGRNEDGELKAPPRWGLMERLEWGQFGPTWEAIRYKNHQGFIWDLKGPCPAEKYVELKCHTHHTGKCCPCIGETCKCAIHCWGVYVEPNENLMDWIRRTAWEAKHDSDVDPFCDVRFFEAPQAQRELVNARQSAFEKDADETGKFDREAVDLFLRNPHTTSCKSIFGYGVKKTKAGLYIVDKHPADVVSQ